MLSLPELQRRMLAAICVEEVHHEPDWLDRKEPGPTALDRLGIHHHNWREGFRKALAVAFPVTERLVGAEYFRELAADFQDHAPSRSGDLNRSSAPFADFIAARFTGGEFDCLGDVARLELLCQQALVTPPSRAAGIETLTQRAVEECTGLHFALQTNVRLLESRYPVSRIWLANQSPDEPAIIDVGAGGECLMVVATDTGIALHRLPPGEFALLRALGRGLALGDALEAALEAVPEFDPAAGLHTLFASAALRLA